MITRRLTEKGLRDFVTINRKKGRTSRDLTRGLCIGRYEGALGLELVLGVFSELWPKHKLRVTAADLVFLRDLNISLIP